MKLLFISNPNSTHTRRWVNWFKQHGHRVGLIADVPLELPWPDMQIFDLPRRVNVPVGRYLPWELWTRGIIRRWQPDILHAHRVSSAGWLGAFSGFHPFVVTPWGSDLYQHPYRSRAARWLAGFTLRRADLVTADSQDLRQQAIRFGADHTRCHLIQWGVDTSLFCPGDASPWRETLHLPPGGPILLSPRAVKPIYNLDTIIRALPAIRAAFPTVVLILRTYEQEPPYRRRLETLVAELGLEQAVRWLGRLEPWERNVDTYRLADIAISVPASDGTPVSLLEAMACGLPVIASDLPSLREWITPGENGLLVPARDATALAEAVIGLLNDPARREDFGRRGRALVRQRADHHSEMSRMEALYASLLHPHG